MNFERQFIWQRNFTASFMKTEKKKLNLKLQCLLRVVIIEDEIKLIYYKIQT